MVMKIFFHKNGTKQQITKFPHPFFFFSLFFSLKNFQEPRTLVRKMRSISYNHFLKFEIRKQLLIPRTCLTKNPSNSTLPRSIPQNHQEKKRKQRKLLHCLHIQSSPVKQCTYLKPQFKWKLCKAYRCSLISSGDFTTVKVLFCKLD